MNEQGTDNNDEARKDNDGDTPSINGFPFTTGNTFQPVQAVVTTIKPEVKHFSLNPREST